MTEIIFERKVADEIIVEKAVKVLQDGGIIVIPTDTIPGIGCLANNRDAIQRLFKLKERPENLPIPVILSDTDDLKKYAKVLSPIFFNLADRYWPGALTIVLRSNRKIDRMVGGGTDTIGFRVPDYPLVRKIVKEISGPLALSSANPHNVPQSALHQKLLKWWKNNVGLLVLGRSTAPRPASAVVDLVKSPHRVIREGLIDMEELESYLKV